ncbi:MULTISPECIES: SDR family NAD(P)-dependent oxidoreductase [unclassified Frondihabitans]|uniref:SDR family NAD(P)-dependent oxidoreductase n=1 Tax=unclassified Frondihabitans TaxID=2626248 RepID=UPI000F50CEEA|nr:MULTISPECIES: SDR family oxidoreductase [unclassified Frondihabitans]MBF4575648.1 SDR family oxidoreductase [Frondihabitans sp. VKM Ac-2883]RPE78295.1 NAD(P)-dependent dehydrogenase (short-subunit alcohol dehydrogenase family) [Frondihabitans sp. PhB153]RPF08576.1 NAD(P)-dependent dehydrogenase (short-subunit alcohol dehydrogenase family) [Frondihabitans sp. PhB161]
MGKFEGKVAIVTGGGSGIGEGISKALAAEGASVVVTDIKLDAAQRVVDEIVGAGGTASAFEGNTSVAADSEKTVEFAQQTYGALHLAVNNAGIGAAPAKIGDYDIAAWDRVVGVDLSGVFYGLRYQLPALVAAGGGAIVNMSSVLGSVGIAQNAAYVASKHALIGLTKVAALEYSAQGVRTNAVGPGFIDTPLVRSSLSADELTALEAQHATGRLGTDAEVAALTLFLLSDDASFITGSYHLVDGGYSAH